MKISDLLSPDDIMVDARTSQKGPLLQELATRAAASLGLPAEQVASYLSRREELGSTGIGGPRTDSIILAHSLLSWKL